MSNVLKLQNTVRRVSVQRSGPVMRDKVGHQSPSLVFADFDLETEAKHSSARAEAEDSVTFEQELESHYDKGFSDGIEQARAEMLEEFNASIQQERERVNLLMESVEAQMTVFQNRSEQTVIRFALGVASLILKREASLDNEVVLRQIHEALRRIVGVDRIKLRVSPEDEEVVRSNRTSILSTSDSIRDMAIEADETISRGGCVIESESGNVDALLETQLKKIEDAIFDEQ